MDKNIEYIVEIILKRVKPYKIFLFGSRSIGCEQENSDYDICIVIKEKMNRNQLVMNLYKDLAVFDKSVDIIIEYETDFNKYSSNKYMIYKDISEGQLLYA